MISMLKERIYRRIFIEIRRWFEKYARSYLKGRTELWGQLEDYLRKTDSTGCNYSDYYLLYKSIRNKKPREVLECGTGVSTLVIAHALMENELENGVEARVTSMEEYQKWADLSEKLLPEKYSRYVDIVVSETVEDYFSVFRGMRYKKLPNRIYDYIFIDGPKYKSSVDGHLTSDFDLVYLLQNSTNTISGLIDQRASTVFVLQMLLGKRKIRYLPPLGVAFIDNVKSSDLGDITSNLSSKNYFSSFKLLAKTRLYMTPGNTE